MLAQKCKPICSSFPQLFIVEMLACLGSIERQLSSLFQPFVSVSGFQEMKTGHLKFILERQPTILYDSFHHQR